MSTDTAENPTNTPPPNRQRRVLLGGVAAAAAFAGAGAAWWRQSKPEETPLVAVAEPVPGFWDLQWDTPQGTSLAAKSLQGRPLLLNFWATWCPPCVEELPLINRFFQEHRAQGWQVVGLAIDKKSAVAPFLQKNPLDFPIAIAGLSGADLGRAMGNLAGALPFTAVIGRDGTLLHRKMGRVSPEDLGAWAGLK